MCDKCKETDEGRVLFIAYNEAQSRAMALLSGKREAGVMRQATADLAAARKRWTEFHRRRVAADSPVLTRPQSGRYTVHVCRPVRR